MKNKMDKKQEEEGINLIGEMIEKISESIEASKQKYINLMVECMVAEAKVIHDARAEGIEFEKIMPEVKAEYIKRVKANKEM